MTSYLVFTSGHGNSAPAHRIVTPVDANGPSQACDAAARHMGIPEGYFANVLLYAQRADDPRCGNTWMTPDEAQGLRRYCNA
jgi:hypothetical protein